MYTCAAKFYNAVDQLKGNYLSASKECSWALQSQVLQYVLGEKIILVHIVIYYNTMSMSCDLPCKFTCIVDVHGRLLDL